jgi:glycosyltransferase involved in cell wall biosynthesis
MTATPSTSVPDNLPELSVVIASVESARSIEKCVASVVDACAGLNAEVLVVNASRDDSAVRVRAKFPAMGVISLPAGTLTPVLWSHGIARSRAPKVALLTAHCRVHRGWARELASAVEDGATGAGGPFSLAANASLTDTAIYFLRYSAFLPSGKPEPVRARDIAGDNAMYLRSAIDRYASLDHGFWEVEFHDRVRASGGYLMMTDRAAVVFGNSFSIGEISRQRFRHGQHFGAWRVQSGSASRARVVVATPVVPFVLLARVTGRVLRSHANRLRFILSSPLILWLASCWAVGEAIGALNSHVATRRLDAALTHGTDAHRS